MAKLLKNINKFKLLRGNENPFFIFTINTQEYFNVGLLFYLIKNKPEPYVQTTYETWNMLRSYEPQHFLLPYDEYIIREKERYENMCLCESILLSVHYDITTTDNRNQTKRIIEETQLKEDFIQWVTNEDFMNKILNDE